MLDKIALARIVVFVLAWVNQYLVSKNMQPLPLVGEDEVAELLTFVISVWTLAKDNRVKKVGQETDL